MFSSERIWSARRWRPHSLHYIWIAYFHSMSSGKLWIHVGVGSSSSFRWLGYTIVGGHCYLEEQKLLAILLVPERYVKDNYIRHQAMRAVGVSYICRNYYPRLRKLIEHFIARVGLEALSKEELVELKRQSEFRTLKIGTTVWSERSDSTRFESAKWRGLFSITSARMKDFRSVLKRTVFSVPGQEAGPTSCLCTLPPADHLNL